MENVSVSTNRLYTISLVTFLCVSSEDNCIVVTFNEFVAGTVDLSLEAAVSLLRHRSISLDDSLIRVNRVKVVDFIFYITHILISYSNSNKVTLVKSLQCCLCWSNDSDKFFFRNCTKVSKLEVVEDCPVTCNFAFFLNTKCKYTVLTYYYSKRFRLVSTCTEALGSLVHSVRNKSCFCRCCPSAFCGFLCF